MSEKINGGQTVRLILASASPRRTDLLRLVGIPHTVCPSHADEEHDTPSEPSAHVTVLAERKAVAVSEEHPGALVLGADTIVYHGGVILGKPRDFDQACRMVASLAGTEHLVYTGIALAGPDGAAATSACEVTRVRFRSLTRQEIERYVGTGEPMDKAGAYGIQGYGATLVESVQGCYFNVMGLPLTRLIRLLEERGVEYPFGPPLWRG